MFHWISDKAFSIEGLTSAINQFSLEVVLCLNLASWEIMRGLSLLIEKAPNPRPRWIRFHPGKSCTSGVLNITQYTEGGFENCVVVGTMFVDLSVAHGIVDHGRLLTKTYMMKDHHFL